MRWAAFQWVNPRKRHRHVAVERVLNLHRDLRRQEKFAAVDGISKANAFLGDLTQFAETENLKSARIREDGLIPPAETVKAAVSTDHFESGAKPQMESVAENDLRTDLLELIGRHRFDSAVSADRHEDRCLNDTVVEFKRTAAGFAAPRLDRKAECHCV